MKQFTLIFLFLSVILFASPSAPVQIIPYPAQITPGEGHLTLSANFTIEAADAIRFEANYLADILKKGFSNNAPQGIPCTTIELQLDDASISQLGEEGYLLSTSSEDILIRAATPAGIFYGIQTLKQLLPVDFESSSRNAVEIARVEIVDQPRFPWRSFMLDEARHFKGKETIYKMLDELARLKMNTFHWHLTDDQGWRIEIKKYPLLTQVGAKRKDTQTARRSEGRTGVPHEGFYTQEEIKEIIQYASDRHITIVPEIEMPGHAMAAIAAYPWLGSMGTTTDVSVIFGKMEDSFNISDPRVVQFLQDVLEEVMALFPGDIIHIGGDEVNFGPWERSEKVQQFMRANDLYSPVDLQIYFTNLISNFIDRNGKRMMGWNEIMGDDIHGERSDTETKVEQKLASSAIVHFWKGDINLISDAVQKGYSVVNSNHWDTYLDYTYERLPLSRSYHFDPIPEDLDPMYHSLILGLGTQMWSEWIPTVAQMENQVFPRLAAYAEVGWTHADRKAFSRFSESLVKMKKRWRLEGIHFHLDAEDMATDLRTQFFPKQQVPVQQMPEKKNLWIFIMAGQSNMAGRGLVAPEDTIADDRVLTINAQNEWILAKEPLHFYQPKLTGLDGGLSFAKKLLEEVNEEVVIALLPTAVGGSSIGYWLNDSTFNGVNLRSNLVEKINLAKEHGTLKGILWHQGESDATPEKLPQYACNLKTLFYLMRFVSDDSRLPIVVGELASFPKSESMHKGWNEINTIIERVVKEDHNAALVPAGDLTSNPDFIHFDAASQRMMGKRYAEAMLQLLSRGAN